MPSTTLHLIRLGPFISVPAFLDLIRAHASIHVKLCARPKHRLALPHALDAEYLGIRYELVLIVERQNPFWPGEIQGSIYRDYVVHLDVRSQLDAAPGTGARAPKVDVEALEKYAGRASGQVLSVALVKRPAVEARVGSDGVVFVAGVVPPAKEAQGANWGEEGREYSAWWDGVVVRTHESAEGVLGHVRGNKGVGAACEDGWAVVGLPSGEFEGSARL